MTTMEKIKIKNEVERILHVPGNYRGGILEFAIVFDYHIDLNDLKSTSRELITVLKSLDKVFSNARLNIIKWINDDNIVKEVSSMGVVQLGRCFEDYYQGSDNKSYDELTLLLKKFYARSKLIIIITDNSYIVNNNDGVNENLHPFLGKKLIKIV